MRIDNVCYEPTRLTSICGVSIKLEGLLDGAMKNGELGRIKASEDKF